MSKIKLDYKEVILTLPFPISQSTFNILYYNNNKNNDNGFVNEIKKLSKIEIIVQTGLNLNIEPLLPIINKDDYYIELLKLNDGLLIEQVQNNILFIKPLSIIRGIETGQLVSIFERGIFNAGLWVNTCYCQLGVFGTSNSIFNISNGIYCIPDLFFLTNEQFNSRSKYQLYNEYFPSSPYMLIENRSSEWTDRNQYENKMYSWVLYGCEIAILLDSIDRNFTIFSRDRGELSLFPHHNQLQFKNINLRVHVIDWNIDENSTYLPTLNIQLGGILNQIVLNFKGFILPTLNDVIIPPYDQQNQGQKIIGDSIEICNKLFDVSILPINAPIKNTLNTLLKYQRNIISINANNVNQSIQNLKNQVQYLQQHKDQFIQDHQNQINSYSNAINQIDEIIHNKNQ